MTAQPDLPHKVSQIRHDRDDLYQLMSKVEKNQTRTAGVLQGHGNELKRHGTLLERHSIQLEALQQTLDLHSGRLDRIEDNQRRQFDHLSAQVAEILGVLRGPAAVDPPPESEL